MYIYNARIYTLDEDAPQISAPQVTAPLYSALAIERGRIVKLGDDQAIRAEFAGRTPGLDLGGRVVIPGLTDAHIHLEHYALGLQKVDCETATRAECLQRVAERARSTAEGDWVLGHGWNQNNWEQGFGSAAELDAIAPRNPVYLTAKSLHAGWANTAALRLARVGAATPDPPDGRLGRDEHGNPDGILFESAMELVADAIPEPSVEQTAQAIQQALPVLWRMGLTCVHDFDRRRCFQALQILRQRGALRLRVLKSLPLEDLPHAVALGLRSGFGDDWLRVGGVKAFMDGALGPHTAAMFEPYLDEPGNRGMLFMDGGQLFEHGRKAVEAGLPLAVHAIGDRANHEALNAFARLRDLEDELAARDGLPAATRLRHRIEHVQVIHPQDVGRLAALGVIASMQPVHVISDMQMSERYWGPLRSELAYAWRGQLENGATLAFGSDAPVESPNPFWGLHAAVTRRRPGAGQAGWVPQQRLDVGQALRAYTGGPAFAAGMERRLGKLAPSYLADLLVLEQDPFTCDPDLIYEMRPLATMVGGEWVFERL
ncbi:MAG: amidohydrolase [Anaerolineales bacterium]|nr:amidohydrolase [Anaerolineales bacterium]